MYKIIHEKCVILTSGIFMKVHEDSPLWLKVTECAWTPRLGIVSHLNWGLSSVYIVQLDFTFSLSLYPSDISGSYRSPREGNYDFLNCQSTCLCVCPSIHPSICLTLMAKETDIYILEIWHEGQGEWFLGQGHRLKVRVISWTFHWQYHRLGGSGWHWWHWPLSAISIAS